jgi:hypothetical protein
MRHPVTGLDTLDRDWASSIYEGGELYYAADCQHGDNKLLGLVCSLCSEAVFLAKGEIRRPTWKHYRVSASTKLCDRRVLTEEGRECLKKLQPPAVKQRLKLFNRRFLDIYRFEKVVPRNPRSACQKKLKTLTGRVLDFEQVIQHCRDRWDVKEILRHLPERIKQATSEQTFDQFLENDTVKRFIESDPDLVIDTYLALTDKNFSPLRLKVLGEVIEWLGTNTARESFATLFYLAFMDCLELFPFPIHSNQVANMIVTSLVLTDWERAIAAIKGDETRAIGFG